MGRLFWKFFFVLVLAQATTIVGVSSAIWLRHRSVALEAPAPGPPSPVARDDRDRPPPPERRPGERPWPGGPGRAPPMHFPLEPIIGGLMASLAVAALLAWYVSKPIRFLRRAFDAASRGDLDARVGTGLGKRRDELADLGRDFDRTAAQIKGLMDAVSSGARSASNAIVLARARASNAASSSTARTKAAISTFSSRGMLIPDSTRDSVRISSTSLFIRSASRSMRSIALSMLPGCWRARPTAA